MTIVVVPDLLTGVLLALAGAVVLRRRRRDAVGLALLGASLAWFLGSLVYAPSQSWLVTVGASLEFLHRAVLLHAVVLATGALRPAQVGHRSKLTRTGAMVLVAASYLISLIHPWAREIALTLTLGMLLIVLVARAALTETDRRRRLGWLPVAIGVATWTAAASALRLIPAISPTALLGVYEAGIAVTALGLAWQRLARSELSELAWSGGGSVLSTAEFLLQQALDDPGLRLRQLPAHPAPDAPLNADLEITPVQSTPDSSLEIIHRVGLLADPRLRASVVGVVRLMAEQHELLLRLDEQSRQVQASRDRLEQAESATAAQVAEEIRNQVSTVLAELRICVHALHEPQADLEMLVDEIIDELLALTRPQSRTKTGRPATDLAERIRSLAARSSIPVRLSLAAIETPEPVAEALTYVTSECLANATKHSRAQVVDIALTGDQEQIVLKVHDDGQGGASLLPGHGLDGLAARLQEFGGDCTLTSASGHGTTVTARCPTTPSANPPERAEPDDRYVRGG